MSAVKFQCPSYKLFEPDYHPQKPIIVGEDERLESPETLTLRYEEAARVAEGGDPRGDSPPRLLDMATYTKAQLPSMHGAYDTTRYPDAPYDQYPPQAFPTQQSDKFAQLNQQSFASNNAAVAQYIPTGPTVVSCQPDSGVFGTKVFLKVSSQYDIFSMTSPMHYFFLLFGSQKCPMQDVTRESHDASGFVYSCSADAPQFMVTGCSNSNVPLILLIEGPSGEEISRMVAGSFQYLEGSSDDITRAAKLSKHDTTAAAPQDDQPGPSPKTVESHLSSEAPTNNYEYPGNAVAQQAQYTQAFPQGTNDMITTYRSSSFAEPHFHRRPAWSNFNTLGSTGRSPLLSHSSLTGRPTLTPLTMPSSSGSGTPQLVRTSTIASGHSSASSYHHMSLYSNKAILKLQGSLDSMAKDWSQEEWDNRRRIVLFRRMQSGSTITATCRPVSVNERPPNSICVSCIWWAEKGECYVTSVDTIQLLEQLVAAPNRFSVEEKNRIRRNLEGFHPSTVSKAKADSEDFFKLIMGFPNPKPRNIEKDVKVFPWRILEQALKKIIGKYSASPSSTVAPSSGPMPQVAAAPYAPLPTPPAQSLGSQVPDTHSQYSMHSAQHDPMPSPRSLSGSQQSWTPYTTAPSYSAAMSARTISPGLRQASPQQPPPPSMRLSTSATPLPAVTTYDTRSVSTGGYATTGMHTPISHPPSNSTPPRWDPAPVNYTDGYPSLATQHAPAAHQPLYGTGSYGDGAPRA